MTSQPHGPPVERGQYTSNDWLVHSDSEHRWGADRRRGNWSISGCPRQDSNLRTRLRRPMLYPLSYGGGDFGRLSAACAMRLVALTRSIHGNVVATRHRSRFA